MSGLVAAAGNETTTRLIGWTGKVLADHPEQRRMLVDDPGLIPAAIEELLRYEAPSPIQARYVTSDVEHHGSVMPADRPCASSPPRRTGTSAASRTPTASTSTASPIAT